ncbi:MAG: PilZ domain-containing protein, partial [Myxococcales bacterium]|nr:PilZ domain-containing protein [Myxococcales bacterium]
SEPPDVIVDAGAIEEPPPTSLDIRFLRGCDWVPARVRALSVRGAYVVTSAPPRLGDAVHVSIGFAGKTALVRGTVYHVTSAEDALSTGASGFAVRFPEYACPPRQRLIEVLLAARHAGVTVRPPPNRTSVRFPVRWPVQLAGAMAAFRAAAHDVSSGGFFIATERAIDVGTEVQFAVPLDVNEVPVEGRARVARVQGSEVAARGIPGGVGMQIVAMDGVHRAAWDQFLGRVRRRSEKRILVGATPERLDSLVTGLGSAGYAVTAGSDPGVLMRLAELDPNPPDAAVIDVELEQRHAASGWLEQVFAARQVQCLTVQGDVIKARAMVDELLLVDQP